MILAALLALTGVIQYAAWGGYLPFVAALSSLRVTGGAGSARVTALDARAMARSGWVVFALPGAGAYFGFVEALATTVFAVTAWLGLRLTVEASEGKVIVRRCAFWTIPWSQRRYPVTASLVVDGWGDEADPEALNLSLGDQFPKLELGWSSSTSGKRANELACEFNRLLGASPALTAPEERA